MKVLPTVWRDVSASEDYEPDMKLRIAGKQLTYKENDTKYKYMKI